MLTNTQQEELKARLEKEKTVLEEELGKLGKRNPSNPSDWVAAKPDGQEFGADRTDNAGVIEEIQGNYAALSELEASLNNVNRALEKMKNNVYGVCEISKEPIEVERLMANPAARTCILHMQDEQKLGS